VILQLVFEEQRMSPTIQNLGIDQLSADDRLRLMGEIWDSLSDEPLGEIPANHREELERRLAARKENPQASAPWEEVRARLRGRK
jgi:putative addiction module component (TIGR02574 family)